MANIDLHIMFLQKTFLKRKKNIVQKGFIISLLTCNNILEICVYVHRNILKENIDNNAFIFDIFGSSALWLGKGGGPLEKVL